MTLKTRNMKKKDSVLIKHLKEIPRIIWYPIAACIHALFGVAQEIYLKSIGITDRQQFERDHATKIMRKAIKNILSSGSNVINGYNSKAVNKIFTLLLEIISFITTYAGFTFFLGNVKPIAPLFMALAVQGGCYYLLNYTASHKHKGNVKRNILCGTLIIISFLTSYMGIFNGVLNPTSYIRNTYTAYQEISNSLLDEYIDGQNYQDINYNTIDKYLNKFTELNSQVKIYLSNRQSNINSVETGGYQRIGDRRVWQPYRESMDLKSEMQDDYNRIDSLNTTFEEMIKNITSDEVYKAYNSIIENPNLLNVKNNSDAETCRAFESAISEYTSLFKALNNFEPEDELPSLNIEKIIEDNKDKDITSTYKLPDYEELIKTAKEQKTTSNGSFLLGFDNFITDINNFFSSDELSHTEEYREIVNAAISENYNQLLPLLKNSKKQLDTAKKDAEIPNSQILPFVLPFNSSNQNNQKEAIGVGIFAALIAGSVDGLALLFSMALLRKRDSSLYYNHVEDVKQLREEMLEDCLMYNCLDNIDHNSQFLAMDVKNIDQINEFIALRLNVTMRGFMDKIHNCYFPTVFNSYGFFCEDDIDIFSKEENRLFITLSNISMIKPFHRHELISVLNHDMSETEDDKHNERASEVLIRKYNDLFDDDKIYYMVSKCVHVWFCDNFSELLENTVIINTQTPSTPPSTPSYSIRELSFEEEADAIEKEGVEVYV